MNGKYEYIVNLKEIFAIYKRNENIIFLRHRYLVIFKFVSMHHRLECRASTLTTSNHLENAICG